MQELRERLAAIEHEQWAEWSKAVAPEVSEARRKRWEEYWVPYDELSEDVKDHDRKYADAIIRELIRYFISQHGSGLPSLRALISQK